MSCCASPSCARELDLALGLNVAPAKAKTLMSIKTPAVEDREGRPVCGAANHEPKKKKVQKFSET